MQTKTTAKIIREQHLSIIKFIGFEKVCYTKKISNPIVNMQHPRAGHGKVRESNKEFSWLDDYVLMELKLEI